MTNKNSRGTYFSQAALAALSQEAGKEKTLSDNEVRSLFAALRGLTADGTGSEEQVVILAPVLRSHGRMVQVECAICLSAVDMTAVGGLASEEGKADDVACMLKTCKHCFCLKVCVCLSERKRSRERTIESFE